MKETGSIKKLKYLTPIIEQIKIDKDISLQLDSSPPIGPSETSNVKPNQISPFKNDLV